MSTTTNKSLRVLIADDESIIRMGLRTILTEMGHTVLSAADGMEAISLAAREQPDIALLDVRMPFKDGLEAAAEISKERPIPIIILTAYNEDGLLDRASTLPVQAYLIKPVKRDDLLAQMRIVMAQFERQQSLTGEKEDLEEKLASRKLIERAKGILMKSGLGEEEAYQKIQMTARSSRNAMSKVAQRIIDTGSL